MHLVHYNLKHQSVGNALTKRDGLAVLGIMFEIGEANAFVEVKASNKQFSIFSWKLKLLFI